MLVAIEGIDGSGKGSQTALLRARIEKAGLRSAGFSFPQYGDNPFGLAVSWYLNGQFGTVDEVSPYLAAVLYAGDRFAARPGLRNALETCDLVVCDRYVPSNLAHQAAKLPASERPAFLAWLCDIEYKTFDLPRPEISVFLDMPPSVAQALVRRKAARSYTSLAADIHENSLGYLSSCAEVYRYLISNDPDSWIVVDCTNENGDLRGPNEISERLWHSLELRVAATQR
jgi:dTMP kinase